MLAAMQLFFADGSTLALSCPQPTLEAAVRASHSIFAGVLVNFDQAQTFDHHATAKATFRTARPLKSSSPSMPIDFFFDDSMAYFAGAKRTPELPEQELKSDARIYFVGKGQQGQPEIRFGGCSMNAIPSTEKAIAEIDRLTK